MIIKEGKEIFYHEDGLADREAGIQIKRDSIFRLYSMSKPVTATAAMILLERGEIDLYEPVSKYLPGFKDQMVDKDDSLVPAEREVTIKDLLSMTSGLVYGGTHKAGKDTGALFKEIDRPANNSQVNSKKIFSLKKSIANKPFLNTNGYKIWIRKLSSLN